MSDSKKTARSVLVLFLLALFIVGCPLIVLNAPARIETEPTPQWRVKRIKPDGTVQKTWIVVATKKPKILYSWGGQSGLSSRYDRHNEMMAPAGWLVSVELVPASRRD